MTDEVSAPLQQFSLTILPLEGDTLKRSRRFLIQPSLLDQVTDVLGNAAPLFETNFVKDSCKVFFCFFLKNNVGVCSCRHQQVDSGETPKQALNSCRSSALTGTTSERFSQSRWCRQREKNSTDTTCVHRVCILPGTKAALSLPS